MFKNLKINGWRQYEDVNIDFHPRLTIITGANSAGKTTLLNVLNLHLGGFTPQLVGVPQIGSYGLKYLSSWWVKSNPFLNRLPGIPVKQPSYGTVNIGTIQYDNNSIGQITIPENVGSNYQLQINGMQQVKGINISSHRPIFRYEAVTSIPTTVASKEQFSMNYRNAYTNRLYGNGNNGRSETFHIKETLISLAAFGPGNDVIQPNTEAIKIFQGFENILRLVLPETLGFQSLAVRMPEVVLITSTGDFPLDGISGGVASIIDLAWQIYMYDNQGFPFVVTIDEPENHLHPQIQKSILPSMVRAFPNCQFVVATHSPFIISSIAESNAYALQYNDDKKVISTLLDRVNKAGTANEILREVLGLDDTMPNWVDDKIDQIVDTYKTSGITKENVAKFKQDLTIAGLGRYIPSSLIKLIEEYKISEGSND